MVTTPTDYGFKWDFMEIIRIALNDGSNQKKKWNALQIKHDNGDIVDIIATKEGFEVKHSTVDN